MVVGRRATWGRPHGIQPPVCACGVIGPRLSQFNGHVAVAANAAVGHLERVGARADAIETNQRPLVEGGREATQTRASLGAAYPVGCPRADAAEEAVELRTYVRATRLVLERLRTGCIGQFGAVQQKLGGVKGWWASTSTVSSLR